MIFPTRRIRGVDQQGVSELWIFSRVDLELEARAYTAAGIKTDAIFVAGLNRISLFYGITGAGTTTIRAIPMDENDELESPFSFQIATAIASGPGFQQMPTGLVVSSFKLHLISTGSNAITAALLGATT